MSRYTLRENDLVCTIGMDFTFQVWATDHRGDPIPMEQPARMTVRDSLGQVLFETNEDGSDAMNKAVILTSPMNGMLQVTIPRAMTRRWSTGIHHYDIWATVTDPDVVAFFPAGQQMPVAKGRFVVASRTTVMEGIGS